MIIIWLQSPVRQSFLWRFSGMQVRRRDRICAARWHKMTCGTSEFSVGRHGTVERLEGSGKHLSLEERSA
jgi:hypothetical protein